jgi:hypothetical protein
MGCRRLGPRGGEGLGDIIIRTDGTTEWKYVSQRPISRTRHLRGLQCY